MSNALAIDPVRRPFLPDPEPASRPVPSAAPVPAAFRVSRPRLLVVGALVAGVGCVLAAQLVLSIQTADGAFELQRLQATSVSLGRQVEVRDEQLEVLAAPQHLAALATRQGLVASGTTAVLRLGDGRVQGGTGPSPLGSDTATVPVADALLPR